MHIKNFLFNNKITSGNRIFAQGKSYTTSSR